MRKVITFPPKLECPACGKRLRPAKRSEIDADLLDSRYRQIAQMAAQGAEDWKPPEEFNEWQKEISPPGSWLFRCDECGNRTLWSREEQE